MAISDSMVDAALAEYRLAMSSDPRNTDQMRDRPGVIAAMQRESSGYEFPAPRHAWMRYMSAPEDEPVESGYGWRGECQRGEKGAEPVTIAVRNT